MSRSTPATPAIRVQIRFGEFVTLMASIMAFNALAIDTMLPALPAIGASLHVFEPNHRQWVISAYLIGFASMQIVFGPVADRYGRRPVLLSCILGYALFGFLGGISPNFATMIATRALQGAAAAGMRVLAIAIVRDRYSGSQMARVLSLTFMVFVIVPMLAPSIGQLILKFGSWRAIYFFLTLCGFAIFLFAYLRLPETLHREHRRAISFPGLFEAFRAVVTTRASLGYTLAAMFIAGALFGFVNSAQQIFTDVFADAARFPLMFAAIAGTMAIGAILNSRIVVRLGMRRVSHSATVLFVLCTGAHVAIAAFGKESEYRFVALQAMTMLCFALASSNFGALAIEPLGAIAGSASSLQGCISMLGAAFLGALLGQSFNGTTMPLSLGYFVYGVAALVIVWITESGRLFTMPRPVTASDAHRPAPSESLRDTVARGN